GARWGSCGWLWVSWKWDGGMPMLETTSPPIQRCMSSLRKSSRVRQKSPPLQAPTAAAMKSRMAGIRYRIEKCRSGMKVPGALAPSTPPARRSALSRPAAAPSIALALDSYDRKDQHGPYSIEGRTNHG